MKKSSLHPSHLCQACSILEGSPHVRLDKRPAEYIILFRGLGGLALAPVRIHLVSIASVDYPRFQKPAFLTGHYCGPHWDLPRRTPCMEACRLDAAPHSDVRLHSHTRTDTQTLSDSAIKHAKACLLIWCVATPVGGGLHSTRSSLCKAAVMIVKRPTLHIGHTLRPGR